MTNKIIDDYKKTIERLQQECTEKTDTIAKLAEQYQILTDIHNSTVKQYEALQKQYITVLDLAKKNADSYEYCLKSLEEEIERLKNDSKKN